MPDSIRIPFDTAIAEPKLLKPWFAELSLPQQVALKIIYGCPLSAEVKDNRGWSELDYWAMTQEQGAYDDLGYLKSVKEYPYIPKEYREAWLVVGIRGGKTDRVAATVTAYEATCGGHEMYARAGRPIICFQVAQDLRMAQYSLHSIKATIDMMEYFKGWTKDTTANRIDLPNGVTILTTPPTVKSIRGYDSPVGVLDEVGVWYTESDSANPDFEIYRQLVSRQAQFEHPIMVGISSPWAKQGLLYQRYAAGTEGKKYQCSKCREQGPREVCLDCLKLQIPHRSRVMIHCTSAGLGNPLIQKGWLELQKDADPRAFARECLAQFQDSLSGFLDSALLESLKDEGVVERPPQPGFYYIAAIDPAFRRDNFALAIVHMDPAKGVVVDVVRRWVPAPGISLNPSDIIKGEIKPLVDKYRCSTLYSDQYQFEALQQLALEVNLSIEPTDFTARSKSEIYGNLRALVNQKRIRLLDHPEMLGELKSLESRLTQGGGVMISAPEGQHDDVATVVALSADKCMWLFPALPSPAPKEETYQDIIQKQVDRKQQARFVREEF